MKTRDAQLKKLAVGMGLGVAIALAAPVAGELAGFDLVATASAQGAGGERGAGMKGGSGRGQQGGAADRGARGSGKSQSDVLMKGQGSAGAAEEEDSDRPDWAGVKGGKSGGGGKPVGAGTKKGDLYGDLYVVLRDADGMPILANDLPQVLAYVQNADGTLTPLLDNGVPVVIPRNEEGDLLTTVTTSTGTYTVVPSEVEFGRLSSSRSPTKVLDRSLADALTTLSTGTIGTDVSGRLTVTSSDGVVTTIDSPLANLAIYKAYMATGSLTLTSGSITVTLPSSFNPTAVFAAAADKTGTIGVDTIMYETSILGLTLPSTAISSYEYDRSSTWGSATAEVLVKQADGTYVVQTVNLYDTLFNATQWTDPTPTGGADDFATSANDYLQVIEYLHDNEVR